MSTARRTEPADPSAPRHPTVTEWPLLVVLVVVSVLGSVVGMQLISTLGITPNTAIIGVLLAVILSRLPFRVLARMRSVHRQNLVQTTISSATFAAANCLLLTIGVPVLLGRDDLVLPMLLGAAAAMVIDFLMLYWVFDSRIFPASGAWPPGEAAAQAIIAGDEGGTRGKILGAGIAVGLVGTALGVPMSGAGVALIGSLAALSFFAIGLLVAGTLPLLSGFALSATFVAHGLMVGAGLTALAQAAVVVVRNRRTARPDGEAAQGDRTILVGLRRGIALYVAAAAVLAVVSGLVTEMPLHSVALWVAYAVLGCIAAEFIVGLSAMHAGWIPAFATALVFVAIGVAIGFDTTSLVMLAGFIAAGSPAFADAGYDFKAGWVLRGRGASAGAELAGRRQQLFAGLIGFAVAAVVVAAVHHVYFSQGMFAPSSRVFADIIRSGLSPSAVTEIVLWAVPGALLQLIGGSRRQLGILFATGLIVGSLWAGVAVACGLLLRVIARRVRGPGVEETLGIFGGGLIAGDAIYSFFGSLVKGR